MTANGQKKKNTHSIHNTQYQILGGKSGAPKMQEQNTKKTQKTQNEGPPCAELSQLAAADWLACSLAPTLESADSWARRWDWCCAAKSPVGGSPQLSRPVPFHRPVPFVSLSPSLFHLQSLFISIPPPYALSCLLTTHTPPHPPLYLQSLVNPSL